MRKGFLVTDKPIAVADVFYVDGAKYKREMFGNVIIDSRFADMNDVAEFKTASGLFKKNKKAYYKKYGDGH